MSNKVNKQIKSQNAKPRKFSRSVKKVSPKVSVQNHFSFGFIIFTTKWMLLTKKPQLARILIVAIQYKICVLYNQKGIPQKAKLIQNNVIFKTYFRHVSSLVSKVNANLF